MGRASGRMPRVPRTRPDAHRAERTLAEAAVLGVVAMWAGNFIVVKAAVETGILQPVTFAFVRFLLGSVLLLAIAARVEGSVWMARRDLVPIVLLGALGFGAYQILWTIAIDDTTAGTSSLIIATSPIFTMLLARSIGSDSLTPAKLAGAAISFTGVALVVIGGTGLSIGDRLVGELMTLIAAFLWGLYTAFGAPFLRRQTPLKTTAWAMTGGTLALAPLGIAQLADARLQDLTLGIAGAVVYSGVISASLGNVIFLRGIRLLGPTRVANHQFLVPAFAIVLGALLLDEPIEFEQILGGIAIAAGILVARSGSTPTPVPEAPFAEPRPAEPA